MAVEIKELVIRAVIKSDSRSEQDPVVMPEHRLDEQAIVEACVKQVLKILQRKQER